VPIFGNRLHGVLQDAVNAVFHGDFRVARFDMNVTGAALECSEDDSFDEFYDGARSGVPRNAIAGERLVALFLRLADLKSESFVACSRTRWDCSVRLSRSPI